MVVKMKRHNLSFLSLILLAGMLMGFAGCFDFDDDGTVDPTPDYQRWRTDEYAAYDPDATYFFQWTYVTAINTALGQSCALTYAYVYDTEGDLAGVAVMFSLMAGSNGYTLFYETRGTSLDRITYMDKTASNELEITVNPSGTVPDYSIEYLGNDVYRFKGSMTQANLNNNFEEVVLSYGDYKGSAINPQTMEISWDMTYDRNVGWYGQQDIEETSMETGVIQWNTYMHDAAVTGTATVNGDVYTFTRGYSDQNWGRSFPQGLSTENQEEYMWGWYHLIVPNTDISIIAGVGRNNTGDPSTGGIIEGYFSDIRYDGKHVGVRYVNALRLCPSCWGINILWQASEGTLNNVTITRDDREDWATLVDNLGEMPFPLNQTVYMETSKVKVSMAYHATLDNSLRFPSFTTGGRVFSDIESLNVNCTYYIKEKNWLGFWVTKYSGTVDCGGLEYGYMDEVTLP